jgi:outer membrane immunogenic protein
MRIKLVALLAGAFGLAATTMASAADMAVKAPAPYAIPYSWTGLYAGVHAGAGWGTVESNVDLGGFTLPISSHEINGPLAGLQIGYNYQMGWALIGLEATGSWSDIKGTTPCLFGIASCTTKTDWMASVAARFGGLVGNNMLVFVKGGAAWAHDKYDANILGLITTSASDTRVGWLGGLGAEYRFDPRWSAVIEYNYMDFGTESENFSGVAVNVDHKQHLIKAGLNFKLF